MTSMHANYPNDNAVPELPAVAETVNPTLPPNNCNRARLQDQVQTQARPFPTALTEIGTEEHPLIAEACWSAVQKLTWSGALQE